MKLAWMVSLSFPPGFRDFPFYNSFLTRPQLLTCV
jgi:hypothetical protein